MSKKIEAVLKHFADRNLNAEVKITTDKNGTFHADLDCDSGFAISCSSHSLEKVLKLLSMECAEALKEELA